MFGWRELVGENGNSGVRGYKVPCLVGRHGNLGGRLGVRGSNSYGLYGVGGSLC